MHAKILHAMRQQTYTFKLIPSKIMLFTTNFQGVFHDQCDQC